MTPAVFLTYVYITHHVSSHSGTSAKFWDYRFASGPDGTVPCCRMVVKESSIRTGELKFLVTYNRKIRHEVHRRDTGVGRADGCDVT